MTAGKPETDSEMLEAILALTEAMRAELAHLRGTVDDLLRDFEPVLAVFRPQNGNGRASYIEMAGAARAMRRQQRGKHE